jgi:hypothetical protein
MNSEVKQMLDWCDEKNSRYFTRRDVQRVTGLEGDQLDGFFKVEGFGPIEPCGGPWWRFREGWLAVYGNKGDQPLVLEFYAYEKVGVAAVNINIGQPVYINMDGELTT